MGIGNRRRATRTNLLRVAWPLEEGYVEEELKFRSRNSDPLRSASDRLYTTIEGEIAYNQNDYYFPGIGTSVVIEYEGEEFLEDSESVFPVTSQIIKLVPLPPGKGQFPVYSTDGVFQPDKWADQIRSLKQEITGYEFVGFEGGEGVDILPGDLVRDAVSGIPRQIFRRIGELPVFHDSTFEYNTPYQYQEASGINFNDVVTLVGDVRPEYNFYVGGYEESLSRDLEVEFPCMYNFVSEK